MPKPYLTFAALLAAGATAGAAHARIADRGVTATYRAADQRYCVRATDADTAEFTGTRLYQRACLTERQWHHRGIHFISPRNAAKASAPA